MEGSGDDPGPEEEIICSPEDVKILDFKENKKYTVRGATHPKRRGTGHYRSLLVIVLVGVSYQLSSPTPPFRFLR